MPIVPASRQPLRAVPQEAPDPKFLAMAAAMMHAQGKLFNPPNRDMTDDEFKKAFTEEYSRKTQETGHMYEPEDAAGIKKHLDDIGEGFFRQDQKGMSEFLNKHSDDYDVLRTPQEGNGKRGYYLKRKPLTS